MNDEELLMLAAKAAGIKIHDTSSGAWILVPSDVEEGRDQIVYWNPLTDDGDAFRLAAQLGMQRVLTLEFGPGGVCATFHHPVIGTDEFTDPYEPFDICAATRRCIVRAAAEIGKSMEKQENENH